MQVKCTQCGGSCEGVRVSLDPEERAPIAARAAELGVGAAVRPDGSLRSNWGRCALLDGTACRLHRHFGADAKPRICRQYPWVAVLTESGLRTGTDPGCFAGPHPADAPVPAGLLHHTQHLDPAASGAEAELLAQLAADRFDADPAWGDTVPWALLVEQVRGAHMLRASLEALADAQPTALAPAHRDLAHRAAYDLIWLRLVPELSAGQVRLAFARTATRVSALPDDRAVAHAFAATARLLRTPAAHWWIQPC